ncbi:hypothetical protein M8J76_000591 [Diaphorina citri]|nr:hypothetical protein M8J76_000591 [Diaphorina citri]
MSRRLVAERWIKNSSEVRISHQSSLGSDNLTGSLNQGYHGIGPLVHNYTPVLTGQGPLDLSGRSVDQFRQSADQFRESGQSGPDVVPSSIENMEIRSVKIHQ